MSDLGTCQVWGSCRNPATGLIDHDAFGKVPACHEHGGPAPEPEAGDSVSGSEPSGEQPIT